MKRYNAIIITGACGYIGYQTLLFFLKKKYLIIAIDRNKKSKRIVQNKFVKYYFSDFAKKKTLNNIFSKYKIIGVIHLAASTNVVESNLNKKDYFINNYTKTVNLFEYSKKNHVTSFVFASSAAIYTEKNHRSFIRPNNYYGITKYKAENYIVKNSKDKIFYSILRYFNVFGVDRYNENHPNNNNSLFSNLLFSKKKIISLYYKKKNKKNFFPTRSFVHVKDVARLNYLAFLNNIKRKSFTENIGNKISYDIRKIIRYFNSFLQIKYKIDYCPKNFKNELLNSKFFLINKKQFKYNLKFNDLKKNIKEVILYKNIN